MTSKPSRSRVALAVAVLTALTAAIVAAFMSRGGRPHAAPDVAAELRRAISDFEGGRLDEARGGLEAVLERDPDHPEALAYWGELAHRSGDPEGALATWRRVPDSAGPSAATARLFEATLMLDRRRARDAERLLRRSLELDPDDPAPRKQLLNLYVMQIRGDAIRAELSSVRALRPLTVQEMLLDVVADRPVLDGKRGGKTVRPFVDADPADLHSRIALARYWAESSQTDDAIRLLDRPTSGSPEAEEARALLAELRAETGDVAAGRRLFEVHPPGDESSATVWFAFGRVLERGGDVAGAADAYAAAARKRPTDGPTRYRLGQALQRLGRPDEAAVQLERAQLIESLNWEAQFFGRGIAVSQPAAALSAQMTGVADALARLARVGEAEAWYRQALGLDPGNTAAQDGLRNAPSRGVAAADEIPSSGSAAASPPPGVTATPALPPDAAAASRILLVDRHADAGIDFNYFNGETGLKYLVETVGGGVAVLDYDGDDWPDLYFCQGSDLPHDPSDRERSDRLFRNRGDGTFDDVTRQAGIAEHGYGIGCAAADVDSDGDPDLYVTNHGRSTLFVNDGDGTFRDATHDAGLRGERMAASAAFADFDADGHLDLYVATYVESLRVCRNPAGEPSACSPLIHEGVPDVLYRSAGDGTFADVSAASGVGAAPNGKGLGVLVADLDDDRRPDVYVANDSTPNFLFFNRTPRAGPITFDERGLSSGTALNARGEAEAGMGVASPTSTATASSTCMSRTSSRKATRSISTGAAGCSTTRVASRGSRSGRCRGSGSARKRPISTSTACRTCSWRTGTSTTSRTAGTPGRCPRSSFATGAARALTRSRARPAPTFPRDLSAEEPRGSTGTGTAAPTSSWFTRTAPPRCSRTNPPPPAASSASAFTASNPTETPSAPA